MFTKIAAIVVLGSAALIVAALAPAHAALSTNGGGENGVLQNGGGSNGGGLNGGGANGGGLNGGGNNGSAVGMTRFAIDGIELPATR